jgi:acyl transferase domain-containing protein/NAD(P)-dependent dehydrogenase (short-subunit alcohol dehydrogenase family)/aryl carrier-like protein
MDLASSQGAMVAAGLSADQVPQWILGLEDQVSIAAINGPTSVTISGAAEAIDTLFDRLESENIFCRRLAVEYAFHSPQMDPVHGELIRSLAHLRPQSTHTPMISTVTGQEIDGRLLNADYWWRNVRQSVRFADAMYRLAEAGYGVAVEIGPHPVLAYSIAECFQAKGCSVRSVASLSKQQSDLVCISKSLGTLYSLGVDIDWTGFYNLPARKLPLPTYPFQLQRLWNESLESQLSRQAQLTHPLLGEGSNQGQLGWQQRIDLKLQDYLSDHKVRGSVIYPAAAMLETAIAATRQIDQLQGSESTQVNLQRLRLHNPCLLSDEQPQWIETRWIQDRRVLTMANRNCRLPAGAERPEWSALATVGVSHQPSTTPAQPDQTALWNSARQRCSQHFTAQSLYAYCQELGLQYGDRFQAVKQGWRRSGEALAEVALPASIDLTGYCLHPALLDGCFHAMIAADKSFDSALDGLYLPAEIREVIVHPAAFLPGCSPVSQVTVLAKVLRKNAKKMWCDLDIATMDGQPLVTVRGFESHRVLSPSTIEATADRIYSYRWQLSDNNELRTDLDTTSPERWLILMDEGRVGQELVHRLRAQGQTVVEAYQANSHIAQTAPRQFHQINPENLADFQSLLNKLIDASPTHVVYLWGLDAPDNNRVTADSLRDSTVLTTLAPLLLVQAWESIDSLGTAKLTIVTRGAQNFEFDSASCDVAQGPLIGFGRVITSEYGRLRCKLVDLPRPVAARDLDQLLGELWIDDGEDEIQWRDGQRWVRRFLPQADNLLCEAARRQLPVQLRMGQSAGIQELRYVTKESGQLQADQVEIEVLAAGLNFSDVMKALDLYPGLNEDVVSLGAECAGRITRVGPKSPWQVGDEVMAVAPGAFASHLICNEALVARKPTNLSFEQAAALPVAFLTAHYALHHCARLERGDSVLIHAASGGVGLAAMQLAKSIGVRILATAGSLEKREYVRRLGASCVMDSRSLAFGPETLQATDGQGVDAVLNSLPGEAIATGLGVLKTGGRFLEIGKRDIYGDAALGLYPFRNNLSLFAIDLDQLFKQQPARMGKLLRDLVPRFESGELHPLPVEVYGADDTTAAFKFMQQGKHIGKVVVQYTAKPSQVIAGSYDSVRFRADASYWIAGGLGGFGLQIAKWLVQCGVRHLVLSGRSQQLRPQAQQVVDDLRAQGATILVLPTDITQPQEVRKTLQIIDQQLPSLAGVIHTAMVLEDKLLLDLDRETLERVLWPKVLGGWNLHQETLDRNLDLFVVFSSLSSVFGHAGQANYSAANALLDSLAHYRRSLGLPGLAINWGHLGEVGYLAEREQLGQRLERQGVLSFTVQQATDCFEYALQTQAVQLSVLRMDWSLWRGLGITNRVSPRFAHLLRRSESASELSGQTASAARLRQCAAGQRQTLISGMLRSKISSLLGMSTEQVREDRALLEMGLDSLMAVELRNWIESQWEINLPISALMRSHSLGELIASIGSMMSPGSNEPAASDASLPADVQPFTQQDASTQEAAMAGSRPASEPSALNPVQPIDCERAADLLEKLDQIPDDQVSQLLMQVLKQQSVD